MIDSKINLDNSLKDKIKNGIQQILNAIFLFGPKAKLLEGNGRLIFSCPYCYDSEKDVKKKRGNLYWNTLYYHCYNGGCNIHRPLYLFFKDFGYDNIMDIDEKLFIIDYTKKFHPLNNLCLNNGFEIELFEKLEELAIPLNVFYKVTNTQPIDINNDGYKILKERYLLHKINYFAWNPYRNALYILNLTPNKKSVIGFSIRFINSNENKRYLTYNIEKLRLLINSPINKINSENKELIIKLNKLSIIYNILNIDFSRFINCFEGAIDSMFMHNSIAQLGINNNLELFAELPNIRYFYDNDETGRKMAIKKLKEGKYVFLWKKFINDFDLLKYINKGENLKDLNDLIKICNFYNLDCYKYIENYFSNKIIDLYYV